jgi:hypothetical protein
VFLYLTKNQYNEGGLVLYGRLLEVRKFSGRHWPSGECRYLLPIKAQGATGGVVESPSDTASWCPDKKRLEELAKATGAVRVVVGDYAVPREVYEKWRDAVRMYPGHAGNLYIGARAWRQEAPPSQPPGSATPPPRTSPRRCPQPC